MKLSLVEIYSCDWCGETFKDSSECRAHERACFEEKLNKTMFKKNIGKWVKYKYSHGPAETRLIRPIAYIDGCFIYDEFEWRVYKGVVRSLTPVRRERNMCDPLAEKTLEGKYGIKTYDNKGAMRIIRNVTAQVVGQNRNIYKLEWHY